MSEAWTRKEGQNPEGGLNAKGRASYKGGTLKAPVKGKASTPEKMRRKGSFLVRMGSSKGPLKDSKGKPTRLALSLKAWGAPMDKAKAVAMGRRLLASYQAKKKASKQG
jgi:hypothetical protein